MCGEILRVSVWRMCQHWVQQLSGFEERVLVPGCPGRASPHTIAKVSHEDAHVRQLCQPFIQLFTLVP